MLGRRTLVVALGVALIGIALPLTALFVPGRYGAGSLSLWYRGECYPFSLHIAKQHPLLGIGLCSPRQPYLQDYKIRYPGLTKEQFASVFTTNRSSGNVLLTIMANLGFPFLVIYTVSLAYLLWRLFACALVGSPPKLFFHPVALLVPITAILFLSQIVDTVLYPQVNWFFHILLGMIPNSVARES